MLHIKRFALSDLVGSLQGSEKTTYESAIRARLIWITLIVLWALVWFRQSEKTGGDWGIQISWQVEPHSWIRPATRHSCWLSMLCDVGRGEADGSRDSSRASNNTTLQSLVADAGAFL
jgi:hypothetical protein